MDIIVDFDGTCVKHEFPKIGEDIGAVPVLKELVENGHRLILFTMRSNCTDNKDAPVCVPEIHNGPFLDDAVNWFKENDIPLYGIQTNPTQKSWTSSPKAYGQLHIDDAALGCPLNAHFEVDGKKLLFGNYLDNGTLIRDYKMIGKPFVCWNEVRRFLIMRGIIKL